MPYVKTQPITEASLMGARVHCTKCGEFIGIYPLKPWQAHECKKLTIASLEEVKE